MENQRKSVEVSADTIEEAIAQGLAQLGKTRDEVEIEVLAEPKRGWLGFGGQKARVRLTVKEEALPKPVEEPSINVEQVAREAVLQLVRKMGFRAQVRSRIGYDMVGDESEEPPLVLNIVGRDLGILIGRRGETLAALQFIARLIVNRQARRRTNIIVDVEGYKARRWRTLTRLARRMAEKVAQSHRPVALEPMPPYERRIIHLALRNHPTVTTKSVGEGDRRRVTIIPREEVEP